MHAARGVVVHEDAIGVRQLCASGLAKLRKAHGAHRHVGLDPPRLKHFTHAYGQLHELLLLRGADEERVPRGLQHLGQRAALGLGHALEQRADVLDELIEALAVVPTDQAGAALVEGELVRLILHVLTAAPVGHVLAFVSAHGPPYQDVSQNTE